MSVGMQFREENRARWIGVRPGHEGSQILLAASKANGSQTIYTVPAGKIFMLCHAGLLALPVATGNAQLRIYDDAAVLTAYLLSSETLGGGTEHSATHDSYWPPIELSEGWYITVYSNAAGVTAYGYIHGWEENEA